MVGRKRTVERRKSKRYKAADGAYAAISPKSHKLGQIIDISMGGLAFKYIDTNNGDIKNDNIENKNDSEESIFLSSMGFYVGDIPFKTISDEEVTSAPSLSSMKVREMWAAALKCNKIPGLKMYVKKRLADHYF